MTSILRRTVGILIGAPITVVVFWIGGPLLWIGGAALFLVSAREYLTLLRHRDVHAHPLVVYGGGLAVTISGALGRFEWVLPVLIASFVLAALVGLVAEEAFTDAALGFVGIMYLALPSACMIVLREAPHGRAVVLVPIFAVWAADMFAYLGGSWIGRHPLAPYISPGKTIEGGAVGLLAAVAVGFLFAPWMHVSSLGGAGLGVLVGVVGPIGDLFESRLKRYAGVKDSGQFLPGHGGVLDRVDSVLFAIPVVYYYLGVIGALR